jgi:hypothetical protein
MTSTEIRFFELPLSTMKWRGVPFTHICEWKRHSPSSSSFGSSDWNFLVVMVTLGSMSMIHFSLFGSESNFELASNFEAFVSTNNDCFERHSSVLCQESFWNSHHFKFPSLTHVTLLCWWLGLAILELAILSLSFSLEVRATLPCFFSNGFAKLKSHLFFCLNFFLILIAYW